MRMPTPTRIPIPTPEAAADGDLEEGGLKKNGAGLAIGGR